MTNYDRIKNMSVEEMADVLCNRVPTCDLLCDNFTGTCMRDGRCNYDGFGVYLFIKWLEQEVE